MNDSRTSLDAVELEPATGDFSPVPDRRPLVPEPLPVRIVAVEDVELPAASGLEKQLDAFYSDILGFERDSSEVDSLVLRAENARLRFAVIEPPIARDSMRAIGIELLSLSETESKLIAEEIPYVRQRGLMPGQDALSLQDPAGNWLSLTEIHFLR